jgi:hypothetical protein
MYDYTPNSYPPWQSEKANVQIINIEPGVTSIGDYSFNWLENLVSVTIPNSVTSVGAGAFYNCYRLESVTIPNGVTSIKNETFNGCNGLETVVIPDSAESIGYYAFNYCNSPTSITIPNSVKSIGKSAFDGCVKLESVTMSDSMETIGDMAFYGCTKLESVTIPDSAETIGRYAFYNCSGLTSIVIPDSAVFSGTHVFAGCSVLKIVTVTGSYADTDGVIGRYFSAGGEWKLPYAPYAAESLRLRDISYKEYSPDNLDLKGGIDGDTGRMLTYKDDSYTWDTVSESWGSARSVSGTLTVKGGSASAGNADVCLEYLGLKYNAKITGTHYSIENVPKGASGYVTAAIPGYYQTAIPFIPSLDTDISGANLVLTAYGEQIQYAVTFGSGPNYAAYANGSPVSSQVTVSEGGYLTFGVLASEGYSASPAVSGSAKIVLQTDGWYRISEIHSDVYVTVTVSADADNGSGRGSDSGSGSNSDNGNADSEGDSGNDGMFYAVFTIIIAAFIVCIAASFILFIIRRREDDREEDGR